MNDSPTPAAGSLTVRYVAIPGGHTSPSHLIIPAAELSWRFSRSAGPGGQSVNTTDSRAELSFNVASSTAIPEGLKERALGRLAHRLIDGAITIAASEQRSQLQNRDAARERLATILADAFAPPPKKRAPNKVPKGVTRRRLENKARRGETKKLRGRIGDY